MSPTPFHIAVPDAEIARIMAKVRAYEWHEMPEGEGLEGTWAYGTNREALRDLCTYWIEQYDWRKAEAALNRFPHFTAGVDGETIHFLHEKGSQAKPRPLIITHGWPGSVVEFLDIIAPLAHPERFGGRAEDGFDVVVPSLPGYGWSAKPARPVGPRTVARRFDRLMTDVLGYTDYLAQGGDWGSAVTGWMGFEGRGARAIHLNMFGWRSPGVEPETESEKRHALQAQGSFELEGAYFRLQSTKPQTLSYAMMDSPVGVAGWILEKFHGWSDLRERSLWEVHTRDRILTNIMIYLVTRTFNTATWMYRGLFEDAGGPPVPPKARIEKPVGVACFPVDLITWAPRSLVERHMNVAHWTEFERGGHFAALERPDDLVGDIRAFASAIGY